MFTFFVSKYKQIVIMEALETIKHEKIQVMLARDMKNKDSYKTISTNNIYYSQNLILLCPVYSNIKVKLYSIYVKILTITYILHLKGIYM